MKKWWKFAYWWMMICIRVSRDMRSWRKARSLRLLFQVKVNSKLHCNQLPNMKNLRLSNKEQGNNNSSSNSSSSSSSSQLVNFSRSHSKLVAMLGIYLMWWGEVLLDQWSNNSSNHQWVWIWVPIFHLYNNNSRFLFNTNNSNQAKFYPHSSSNKPFNHLRCNNRKKVTSWASWIRSWRIWLIWQRTVRKLISNQHQWEVNLELTCLVWAWEEWTNMEQTLQESEEWEEWEEVTTNSWLVCQVVWECSNQWEVWEASQVWVAWINLELTCQEWVAWVWECQEWAWAWEQTCQVSSQVLTVYLELI